MLRCFNCKKQVSVNVPVGRRETCPHCGTDFRCCLQCNFHQSDSPDQCREPSADPVKRKDLANFCEFFELNSGGLVPLSNQKESVRAELESLFKKDR